MSIFTPRGVFYIHLILIMLSLGLKSKQTRSEQKTSPVPSMARRSLSHAYGLAQDQKQSLSNQILREIACFRGFSLYQTCCRGVVGQRTKDVRTYFCYQQKAIRRAAKKSCCILVVIHLFVFQDLSWLINPQSTYLSRACLSETL